MKTGEFVCHGECQHLNMTHLPSELFVLSLLLYAKTGSTKQFNELRSMRNPQEALSTTAMIPSMVILWLHWLSDSLSIFIPAHETLGSGCESISASVLAVHLHHQRSSGPERCRGRPDHDLHTKFTHREAHTDVNRTYSMITLK